MVEPHVAVFQPRSQGNVFATSRSPILYISKDSYTNNPEISGVLKRLDDAVTKKKIKNLFNRECAEIERKLFSLQVRLREV